MRMNLRKLCTFIKLKVSSNHDHILPHIHLFVYVGDILHFDDHNLKDLYFLDPQWLAKMMAEVIRPNNGIISPEGNEELTLCLINTL